MENFRIGDHQYISFKEHLWLIRAVSFELGNSDIHVRKCPEGYCNLCLSINGKTKDLTRISIGQSHITSKTLILPTHKQKSLNKNV